MNATIEKIIADRAIIRAFDDVQIEILKSVLVAHGVGAAIPAPALSQSALSMPTAPASLTVPCDAQNFSLPMQDSYIVYVDGGCSGNPGPGGWAAWFPESQLSLTGGDDATTNNRMEIIAAARAIAATPAGSTIEIRTDSKLVVETMAGNWGRKSNQDLWAELDLAVKGRTCRFTWVRGHNGEPGNEKANELAQAETQARRARIAAHKAA